MDGLGSFASTPDTGRKLPRLQMTIPTDGG
jgi:hypothetical protein